MEVQSETNVINEKSIMYWRRAMERPLHLAPEQEDDGKKGKKVKKGEEGFLKGW